MRFFRTVWLGYFILILISGCATDDKNALSGQLASKNEPIRADEHTAKLLKTAMMSKDHELVENTDKDRLLYVSLLPIPGALAGMPRLENPILIRTRLGDDFVLPIADLRTMVEPLAAPANDFMRANGVVVTPSDTRLLRIGTFFQADFPATKLLGAGLIDTVRHQNVVLAYFDRACSVEGDVHNGDLVISFSLKIPDAGLYWLRSDDTDPQHVQTKLEDSNTTLWYALIE